MSPPLQAWQKSSSASLSNLTSSVSHHPHSSRFFLNLLPPPQSPSRKWNTSWMLFAFWQATGHTAHPCAQRAAEERTKSLWGRPQAGSTKNYSSALTLSSWAGSRATSVAGLPALSVAQLWNTNELFLLQGRRHCRLVRQVRFNSAASSHTH